MNRLLGIALDVVFKILIGGLLVAGGVIIFLLFQNFLPWMIGLLVIIVAWMLGSIAISIAKLRGTQNVQDY